MYLVSLLARQESSHRPIRKSKACRVHAWAFPLAAWYFSFQKRSSPFLARANTTCKEQLTSIINWAYLFCFIIICWGCLTSSTLFFCNKPIWLAHCKKNLLKLWRFPKIEDYIERWSASPGFSCLLAHVVGPCMVLHKTTQHGSTCFFNYAKELSNVLLI